jgi:sugar phosphate permease
LEEIMTGRLERTVIPLLATAAFINYVDRGNLATAAPLIKDQLRLSSTEVGVLLSAFFWSYVPGQLLAGWSAERINAYRTLAIGLALWAVATAATGLDAVRNARFTHLTPLRAESTLAWSPATSRAIM